MLAIKNIMTKRITAYSQILENSDYADIIDPIDQCPVCKKSGDPIVLKACFIGDPKELLFKLHINAAIRNATQFLLHNMTAI